LDKARHKTIHNEKAYGLDREKMIGLHRDDRRYGKSGLYEEKNRELFALICQKFKVIGL